MLFMWQILLGSLCWLLSPSWYQHNAGSDCQLWGPAELHQWAANCSFSSTGSGPIISAYVHVRYRIWSWDEVHQHVVSHDKVCVCHVSHFLLPCLHMAFYLFQLCKVIQSLSTLLKEVVGEIMCSRNCESLNRVTATSELRCFYFSFAFIIVIVKF